MTKLEQRSSEYGIGTEGNSPNDVREPNLSDGGGGQRTSGADDKGFVRNTMQNVYLMFMCDPVLRGAIGSTIIFLRGALIYAESCDGNELRQRRMIRISTISCCIWKNDMI